MIALAAVALIVIVCGGLGAVLFLSRRPKPPSFVAIADSSRDLARRPMARDLNPAQDQPPVDAAPLMTATSPQLPPAKPVDGSRAQAAPAPASLATVVDDVRHSVATIIVDADWMGTRGGFGSGFVVGRGRWLATNLHVVAGAGHLKAVRKRDDRDDWIDIDVSGFVACDPKKDLVVLVLEKDWPSPPLRLAHRRIHLGEDVFAVGTPKGLSETVTRGIVSQLRSAGDLGRHELGPKTAIIQTDAFMTNGNSGGPLCSALGEVIGINSFVMKDAADNVQFQFAVAAEELTRLLGRAHAPRPLRDLPRDGD